MKIEYEATFKEVNKEDIRARLEKTGAVLKKKEFLQKRTTFNLGSYKDGQHAWVRVRDEGDRITMSYKEVNGSKIEDQKEIELLVNDYQVAERFVLALGCEKKAYQETKRELWELDGVEIMIDTWPFLDPFIEIEGKTAEAVKDTVQKLGFEYGEAIFGSVDVLYNEKYGVSKNTINNKTPLIVFDMENPFVDN
ncbi:adenylyl cyclase [Candidatus Parcubacteria bacterium]|nr:MAG: adenylyl cyclase [Candidatus Parcubacteria bacterium]